MTCSTTYSIATLDPHLDSLIALIDPEMDRQFTRQRKPFRMGSKRASLAKWITTRCTELEQGMIDCYELSGPLTLPMMFNPPDRFH